MVCSIAFLFISGDNEDLMFVHENLGYFVALLIVFRFYHSIRTSSKHEKISSWFHSWSEVVYFLRHFFTHKETKFHNPVSSLVIIVLMLIIIVNVISGVLGFSGVENEGYFSYFFNVDYDIGKIFLDIHSISTNILLFFLSIHIVGSIVGSIVSKTNMVKSIFIFRKNTHDEK